MKYLVTDLRYCLSSDTWMVALKTEMKKSHCLPCKGVNTKLAILHNTNKKKINKELQHIILNKLLTGRQIIYNTGAQNR